MALPVFHPISPDGAKDFTGNIIIIGAGTAGLFAARTLDHMSMHRYAVLEASGHVGGRLMSTPDDFISEVGVPHDLGAEWVHANTEQVVKDMLNFGFGSDANDDKGLQRSEFIRYAPDLKLANRALCCCGLSSSWIYQETKWKRSSWWHYLQKYVYDRVQDKVELNCPVTEISYDEPDGKVKVVLGNGEVRTADKVICTIPLAVLQKGTVVKFNPPLPDRMQEAIRGIEMPPGYKVFFQMKEKFYEGITLDDSLSTVLMRPDSHAQLDVTVIYDAMWGKDSNPKGPNVCAVVSSGFIKAGALCNLDDDNLALAALAKIDKLYDGQGSKNMIKYTVKNWAKEPYVLGAYSFPSKRENLLRPELGKTVANKVLFAGEHTSINNNSSVPGAAFEGRRAALEAVSGRIIVETA